MKKFNELYESVLNENGLLYNNPLMGAKVKVKKVNHGFPVEGKIHSLEKYGKSNDKKIAIEVDTVGMGVQSIDISLDEWKYLIKNKITKDKNIEIL